jgi:signal transduction histidine kinase/ligand-binding sensor domain-containing protein/DNA-binding response OmpR family regulator
LPVLNLNGQTYNLRCKNIGIPEGLSNNHITDIIQDEYHYIWIATERGLNRYDGSEMINYPLSKDKGSYLYNNHIFDLQNNIDGGLWIVTRDELIHYENGSFQQKRITENRNIVINGVGTVGQKNWFFTSEGVYEQRQDKSGFEKVEVSPRTNFKYSFINSADISTALFNPHTNELWMCTATKGVYMKNLETGNIKAFSFKIRAGRADNNLYIHEALLDSTGNIWFAGPEGLWCKPKDRENGLKIEFAGTAYVDNEVYSIELDRQGNIWCAVADLGIILLNSEGEVIEHLDAEDHNASGLSSGFIKNLFIDDKNNLWAGHQESGIDYFVTRYSRDIAYYKDIISVNGSVPTSVKKIVPLDGNEVLAVYESPSNPIISKIALISTADGNNYSRPSNIQHINLNQTDLDITELLRFENQFAVSTYDNLYRFNSEHLIGNTPVINIHPESLTFNDYVMFHYLHNGTYWLLGQNLRKYDISKKSEEVHMKDLNLDRFVIDNNGILWGAASHNGLVIIDLQNRKEIAQFINDPLANNSISDNNILCLFKDSNGNLWIGTEFGLNRIRQNVDSLTSIHSGTDYSVGFNDLRFIRFQTQDGLSGNVIKSLIEDNQKRLWIATDQGISVLDLSDHTLHTLGFFDGIQEGSFLLNSCAKGEDGTLYFGGENGLNFFNPEHISFEKEFYSIHINRLDILKERISVGSKFRDKVILNTDLEKTTQIELSYKDKLIKLGFVAVDFEHPGEVEYYHMLDGFDIDWIKSLEGNNATYTKLRPGSYTFKVKARTINHSWTEEAKLIIVVNPPFWASWWFIVLLSLLIVLLVLLYIRYRLSSLKSQKEKLELLVRKRTDELEQANAMKIRFFTNISHEIRTPLTLILAPIEHLINSEGIARSVQKKHALIYRNAQRLHDLINQLLQFRKIETGNLEFKPTYGEPIKFIEELAAPFFDYASQKGQKFILDIQAEKIETWFDEDKLHKILTNLLSNAIKYTPKEGKITLKASTEFDNSEMNPILRLDVSDTGLGIDQAKLERIFDRFYEVEDSNLIMEGTGIGLALTKALVELYKGKITVTSQVGEGSCFSVWLPMGGSYLEEFKNKEEETEYISDFPDEYVDTAKNKGLANSEASGSEEEKATILIVEDNKDLCCFIQDLLCDNYHIQVAHNGREALELLTEDHGIDLVISDIIMPVMDGLTFCREIKNNIDTSHIPVLLLTAKHGEESVLEGLKCGADDYIYKPFNEEILKVKIKNVLAFRENLKLNYLNQLKIEPSNITTTSRDKDFIEKAIKVVEESISDSEFDIKTFASNMAVSPSTMLRKMKAITGESSDKFIRTLRLKRAAQLLQSSQLLVTEICYEVGFSSQKHFSATFKKQFGLSPSEYKKQFSETI